MKYLVWLMLVLSAPNVWSSTVSEGVRFKELARLVSVQEQAIVGYGIVTGLAGTGDSPRNHATMQSVSNILQRFGVHVPVDKLRSRNSAAVMVTATLPPYSQSGDQVDVNVTSLGDARSLVGGTLLLTPLAVHDREIFAMAQGALSVGGFSYDLNGNLIQKNHPTAAYIPNGATVNRSMDAGDGAESGAVVYKLYEPDFATADRLVNALNTRLGGRHAVALDAARIRIAIPESYRSNVVSYLTQVEGTSVVPNTPARVVVNERTGTVVAGGSVRISPVSITHGNLRIAVSTDYVVSQPLVVGSYAGRNSLGNLRTEVVPDTTIEVTEEQSVSVSLPQDAKVDDLVVALNRVKATSRDIITVLQGIKRAGALHAELVVQ